VNAGATLACTISFPATGGATLIPVRGGTGADNDVNGGSDPTAGNNPSVTPVVVNYFADLAVQKNGPASVAIGSTLVYTITLINNGPAPANGATFVDTLPAGLTNVTATCTGTGGAGTSSCASVPVNVAAGSISGSIPTFPSGGSVVITVTATAPASGQLVNVVTIAPPSGLFDPDLTNNTSTVTTNVGTPANVVDLAVTKVGTATVATAGLITYVIDVVNAGPSAANGATFVDTLPSAVAAFSWTCTATGGAVCPAAAGSIIAPASTLTQTIATFPMNGRLRYVVTGVAPNTAMTLTNTATVTAPAGLTESDLSNNTSSAVTVVTAAPASVTNLSMSKIGPATVLPFGAVTYTMVATNNGPNAANGAVVVDAFPSVLTGVSWTCVGSSGAVCGTASGTGNLNLTLTTFPNGGQATIRVTGTAPASGTFQNSSRISTPPGVTDSDPSDDIGGPVITTILLGPPDLITTITIPTAPVTPGLPVTATVTMGNIGPTPAGTVTVTLQLPPGVTAVNPSNGGVYNPATRTVTWPVIGFVPANTNPLVTYTVTFVPPSTGGTLTSNVNTPDTEVTLVNNPATAVLRVQAVVEEPVPIPTAPWWAIAFALVFVARRSLRQATNEPRRMN
jgi:uncharacterized repeat protein (TIGR01451 family)